MLSHSPPAPPAAPPPPPPPPLYLSMSLNQLINKSITQSLTLTTGAIVSVTLWYMRMPPCYNITLKYWTPSLWVKPCSDHAALLKISELAPIINSFYSQSDFDYNSLTAFLRSVVLCCIYLRALIFHGFKIYYLVNQSINEPINQSMLQFVSRRDPSESRKPFKAPRVGAVWQRTQWWVGGEPSINPQALSVCVESFINVLNCYVVPGAIPAALGNLSKLTSLSLRSNELSGKPVCSFFFFFLGGWSLLVFGWAEIVVYFRCKRLNRHAV